MNVSFLCRVRLFTYYLRQFILYARKLSNTKTFRVKLVWKITLSSFYDILRIRSINLKPKTTAKQELSTVWLIFDMAEKYTAPTNPRSRAAVRKFFATGLGVLTGFGWWAPPPASVLKRRKQFLTTLVEYILENITGKIDLNTGLLFDVQSVCAKKKTSTWKVNSNLCSVRLAGQWPMIDFNLTVRLITRPRNS